MIIMIDPLNIAVDSQSKRSPNLRRSKDGCPQCRKQKVKCDECLPQCTRCIKRNLSCGYLNYSEKKLQQMKAFKLKQEQDKNPSFQLQENNKFKHLSPTTSTGILSPISQATSPLQPIPSNNDDSTMASKLNKNTEQGHQIKLVKHLKQTVQGHYTNSLTSLLSQCLITPILYLSLSLFILNQFKDSRSFDGAVLLAYGSLISKQPDSLQDFIRFQNVCMNHILKSLNNLTDDNVIPILTVAIALDLSSTELNENILGYNQHSKFSKGPSSILKTVINEPLKFPNSYPILKRYNENLSLYSYHESISGTRA